ncbi:MAG: cyclodeaminase/cyclohydrolase family protein [Pseudonocardia sp.]|nr:cyclodeaminase/cyclohydrolase family protein [Pseudonocardia sp.]
MSDGFGSFTVDGFLAAVAAREPAPGGGAVTAVTVAAAAGLVAMAARFAADPTATAAIVAEADDVRTAVTALADADAQVYGAVLAAFRTPRDDPGRRAGIRHALERAADVPLRIAEAGARVARLGAAAAEGGNPNLAGDVRAGVVLAAAAATAAAELVRINVELGGLDPAVAAAARAHVDEATAARDGLAGARS